MKLITLSLLAVIAALMLGGCKEKKIFETGKVTTIAYAEQKFWLDEGKKTRTYYWDSTTKVTVKGAPGTIESLKADDDVKIKIKRESGKRIAEELDIRGSRIEALAKDGKPDKNREE